MKLKSTKLLFLYRSLLLCFLKFETDDDNLITIVNALNIKNRKKRIEYIYDEAVKEINIYYKDDLCQFKNNKCIVQRKRNDDRVNGCCYTCPNLGKKGCSTINLPCKLVYCKTALKNMKKLKMNDIKILKCLSPLNRVILKGNCHFKREQIINDLYYGPLIAPFRIFYRQIILDTKLYKKSKKQNM